MPGQHAIVTGINRAATEQMQRAVAAMSAMQESPVGTRKRTPQERAAIWKQLQGMEKPERQGMMESMAQRAGHQSGEQVPCEMCNFIAEHA